MSVWLFFAHLVPPDSVLVIWGEAVEGEEDEEEEEEEEGLGQGTYTTLAGILAEAIHIWYFGQVAFTKATNIGNEMLLLTSQQESNIYSCLI